MTGMQIIPAIDLMKGKVVRLTRGDPNTAKTYEQWGTPVQVALRWKREGAKRLHIIDLDAAFGFGNNFSVVADITRASDLPIQIGGGIRSVEAAEKLFKLGAKYIILGALAFSDPEAIPRIQKRFGADSIIIALDNMHGKVMVEGWKTETAFTISQALKKYVRFGARSFLITSITQDGMLQGPDFETLRKAAECSIVEIIAAGGIGSLSDLVALRDADVKGVIVGKALYEERFTLKAAFETVEETRCR